MYNTSPPKAIEKTFPAKVKDGSIPKFGSWLVNKFSIPKNKGSMGVREGSHVHSFSSGKCIGINGRSGCSEITADVQSQMDHMES